MNSKKIPEWFPKVGDQVRWEAIDRTLAAQIDGSGKVDTVSLFPVFGIFADGIGMMEDADPVLEAIPAGKTGDPYAGKWRCRRRGVYTAVRLFRCDDGSEITILPASGWSYLDSGQQTLLRQLEVPDNSDLAKVHLPNFGDTLLIKGTRSCGKIALKTTVCDIAFESHNTLFPLIVSLAGHEWRYLQYCMDESRWWLVDESREAAARWIATFEIVGGGE